MWYRNFRCGIGIFPLRAFSDTTSEIISNRVKKRPIRKINNHSNPIKIARKQLKFSTRKKFTKIKSPKKMNVQDEIPSQREEKSENPRVLKAIPIGKKIFEAKSGKYQEEEKFGSEG
jgi:hypothetical protein